MTDDFRIELATLTADTVVAADTDSLGSDFTLRRGGNLVRVTVQAAAAADDVLLVPDSGTALNLGALSAGVASTFEVALDHGRTWNVQTSTTGGWTIEHLAIIEVQA